MEDHVYIVEDKVYVVDNNLWVTCCGCTHVSCGVGIVEDCVCIVGAASTHNICVCTHNVYPQHIQLCALWVQIVGAHIYCGYHVVGNLLCRIMYTLWIEDKMCIVNMCTLWRMRYILCTIHG